MSTDIVEAPTGAVPKGRGSNPLNAPVREIASKLVGTPHKWFVIGTGEYAKRSRLSNAAALLSGNRYKKLQEFYDKGHFEVRVSGARNAPHKDEYEVAVFARFVPNE